MPWPTGIPTSSKDNIQQASGSVCGVRPLGVRTYVRIYKWTEIELSNSKNLSPTERW